MNGGKVVAALTHTIKKQGAAPGSITLDKGSEFAGRAMEAWTMDPASICASSGPGDRLKKRLYQQLLMAGFVPNAYTWSGSLRS